MLNPQKNATAIQRNSVISRSPTKMKAQRADIVFLHEEFNICEDKRQTKQTENLVDVVSFINFLDEVECVVSKLILLRCGGEKTFFG